MRTALIAIAVNNQSKGRPNLSFKVMDGEGEIAKDRLQAMTLGRERQVVRL